MEKSGFFNALNINGEYDRKYNANDYCDNLRIVISNGVLRSLDDDLITSLTGLIATVGIGRAWINGHYYYNTTPKTFTVPSAPAGGGRYDRIVLRLNNNITARKVSLEYVIGTAGNNPEKPVLTRNEEIYELGICDIYTAAGSTSPIITDTRADNAVCGWVYSTAGDDSFFKTLDNDFNEWYTGVKNTLASTTLFKKYIYHTVIDNAETTQISFDIPQYDSDTCFLEVYVNGLIETRCTSEGNVITFSTRLDAGTEVLVACYKSIDGTGITSVSDEITALQMQFHSVDGIARYTYDCKGINDNIVIGDILKALVYKTIDRDDMTEDAVAFIEKLGGNDYLQALPADFNIQIDVVGNFVASTPYSGDGTEANPYKWLILGKNTFDDSHISFNFAKCETIKIDCNGENTSHIICYGSQQDIDRINIKAFSNNNGVNISMVDCYSTAGKIRFNNSIMKIETSGAAMIAKHGEFNNCYCNIISRFSSANCFVGKNNGYIVVNGGEFLAYTVLSSGIASSVFYISAGDENGAIIATNIYCPQITKDGYDQAYLSNAANGSVVITNAISALPTSGTYSSISGLINKNKIN